MSILNTEQHRDLMHEFQWLGKATLSQLVNEHLIKERGSSYGTQGLTPLGHAELVKVAERAQSHVIAYREMHGSLRLLRQHVISHMQETLHPADKQDLMPRIIAYSLLADTPYLPSVLQALSEDVGDEDLFSIRDTYRNECLNLLNRLNRDHLPPMPINHILAGGQSLYQFIYEPNHEVAANLILDKFASIDLVAGQIKELTDNLAAADHAQQTSWDERVWRRISLELMDRPLSEFLPIRALVNGTQSLSGAECSRRVDCFMRLSSDPDGLPERMGNAAEYAFAIGSNETYYEKLLVHDLVKSLLDEIKASDDEKSEDYDYGVQVWMRQSEFFKALQLSDEDLSFILLQVISENSLGTAYERAQENPAIGAIVAADHLFRYRKTLKKRIETEPKEAICFGLWHAMSQFAMGQALQKDSGRVVMYQITQNRLLLNGIKDKSLVDDVFSADLGL